MIGRLIGLGFAWLWLLVGAGAAGRAGIPLAIAGSVLIGLAVWRVLRRPREGGGQFIRSYYIAAVVAELVAIAIAQSCLARRGLDEYLFPLVGVIVGLHFIGLWAAMRQPRFLWLTGALVAVNGLAVLLSLSANGRLLVSGFGSSASLLAAAGI